MKLKNRRIVVTGASSGIGLEVIKLFENEGARLALMSRDEAPLQAALQSLRSPAQHCAVTVDCTDPEAVSAAVKLADETLGGLDGLVHSAGRDHIAPFTETTLTAWQDVMSANVTSAYLMAQACVPALRTAGGGTIVTMASGAALSPLAGRTAYCTAKAALVMFSKTLALELASDNIRVNALCPGAIDTPMLRSTAGGEHGDPVPKEIVARFAMGRIGEADEIARATLFLMSEDSSFVTGVALAADGGRTFH